MRKRYKGYERGDGEILTKPLALLKILIKESGRHKRDGLAERLDCCERTIYRLFGLLANIGIKVVKDEDRKYLITNTHCPCCMQKLLK